MIDRRPVESLESMPVPRRIRLPRPPRRGRLASLVLADAVLTVAIIAAAHVLGF